MPAAAKLGTHDVTLTPPLWKHPPRASYASPTSPRPEPRAPGAAPLGSPRGPLLGRGEVHVPTCHFCDCEPQSHEGGGAWTAARAPTSASPVSTPLLAADGTPQASAGLCRVCACDRPRCSRVPWLAQHLGLAVRRRERPRTLRLAQPAEALCCEAAGQGPAAGTRPRRVQWEAQAGLRSHGSLSASAGSHDTHCHLSESPSLPHHRLLTHISGSSAPRKRRQTSGRGISHIWAAAPRGRESTNFTGPARQAPELTAAAPGTLGRGSGSYRAVPGSTQHLTENRTRAWLSSTCHRM